MGYLPLLQDDGPRYLALVRAISSDIQAARLLPGSQLPGTRTLAKRLHLNRNTIVRAYAELEAQGWIHSHTGSGTRVSEHLEPKLSPRHTASRVGFLLPPKPRDPLPLTPRCRYAFVGGQPDLRALPMPELARAYRRALQRRGRILLDYGDPQGQPVLRRALADWLCDQRGMQATPEQLLITRGSQQALYLVAHAVFQPGDRIAVEQLGYRPAWQALRSAGLELVPVPVDAQGMHIATLQQLQGIRGVYLTPHHQYPTGGMLSAGRRRTLLQHCAQHRIAILEDDYDHEFHWQGSPVAPLAARDEHGVVLYLGTLSKALAPGLRLGWVVAPEPVIKRLTPLRRVIDRQGDQVVEHAVAELITEGELQRHIRRMHRIYRGRRAHLIEALQHHLPELVAKPGPGGLAIWCEAPGINLEAWRDEARTQDVGIQIASDFAFDTHVPCTGVRMGFAALTETEIDAGLERLIRRVPLAGLSCESVRLGNVVQKRYPSTRSAQQARAMIGVVDPTRLVQVVDDRTLHLRWLPGASGSLDPAAHEAAGVWLRALHDRAFVDPDPMDLGEALQLRAQHTLRAAHDAGLAPVLPALPTRCRRVHCHRDYRPANWLWQPPNLQVIDFEHSRPDHPMGDLVKLQLDVWPEHPELEAAFCVGYGPLDRAALHALGALFQLQSRLFHGDRGLNTAEARATSTT